MSFFFLQDSLTLFASVVLLAVVFPAETGEFIANLIDNNKLTLNDISKYISIIRVSVSMPMTVNYCQYELN